MSTFQVISDIHLEMYPQGYNVPIPTPKADILILAGDIGNVYKRTLDRFLSRISPLWKHIYYVLGNHEFYHPYHGIDRMLSNYEALIAHYSNIELLYKGKVCYENGYTLIGCTLWSEPTESDQLNDFKKIHGPNHKAITLSEFRDMHYSERDWLVESIKSRPSEKIIVVTHFPPVQNTSHPKYASQDDSIKSYFMNNLLDTCSELTIHENVHAWVYGHTHYSNRFTYKGTLCISSQVGYMDEEQDSNYNETLSTFD